MEKCRGYKTEAKQSINRTKNLYSVKKYWYGGRWEGIQRYNGDPIHGFKFGTNNGTIDYIEMSRNLYRIEVTSSFRSRNLGSRVGRAIS